MRDGLQFVTITCNVNNQLTGKSRSEISIVMYKSCFRQKCHPRLFCLYTPASGKQIEGHDNFIQINHRLATVNSKSFVGKDFLQNKWKYKLTVHFKHETIGKHFTETSNKLELRINRVRINRARPVIQTRA